MSYEAFWGAVVQQAALDLLRPETVAAEEADRERALDWVKSDNTGIASYLWACDVAGIDPNILRDKLRARGWM